jgi:hypothetical protein
MGNTTAKELDTSSPTWTWDDATERAKYVDSRAKYVFNFYGEYSRDEFLKAHVDDPELEKKVKEYVENRQSQPSYDECCRSCATSIHHKGDKYGVAWHNMAYIDPVCTITLLSFEEVPVLKVYRFLGNNTLLTIRHIQKQTKVTWDHRKADITAKYICDLVGDLQILTIENNLGIKETRRFLSNNDELQPILVKLIEYMTCIRKKAI